MDGNTCNPKALAKAIFGNDGVVRSAGGGKDTNDASELTFNKACDLLRIHGIDAKGMKSTHAMTDKGSAGKKTGFLHLNDEEKKNFPGHDKDKCLQHKEAIDLHKPTQQTKEPGRKESMF